MLTIIFQIKFTVGILVSRRFVPSLNRILNSFMIACLVTGTISLLIPVSPLINLLIVMILVVEGLIAFRICRQGYRPARFYLVSWAVLLVAGVGYVLGSLNLLFGFTLPESIVKVAMAVGALFGSLALADRVQLLKVETEASVERALKITSLC